MNVLLVEDSPTDALLAQNSLSGDPSFRVIAVTRLSEALSKLKEKTIDVILLDLGLPDSQGLDTLHAIHPHCQRGTAIVVLTVNNDRHQAASALRSGAQDYLFKNHISNPEALRRCIVYASERRHHITRVNSLERDLELARKAERAHEETVFWFELSHSRRMEAISSSGGVHNSLQDAPPRTLEEIADDYANILEKSVEQRHRKTSHDIASLSALLAMRLGENNASPREVIDIHVTALRQKMDQSLSLLRAEAYQEEGRLRLVELMGFLIAHYRSRALGSVHQTPLDDGKKTAEQESR